MRSPSMNPRSRFVWKSVSLATPLPPLPFLQALSYHAPLLPKNRRLCTSMGIALEAMALLAPYL